MRTETGLAARGHARGWMLAVPAVLAVSVVLGYALAHQLTLVVAGILLAVAGLLLVTRPKVGLVAAIGCIPLTSVTVGGLPLDQVILLSAIVVFGLFALGTREDMGLLRLPPWVLPILVAALALVVISGLVNGTHSIESVRRLVSLGLSFATVYVIGRGVLEDRWIARALAAGLLFSGAIGFFYLAAGLDDTYQGRLIGLFGDPNVAGFQVVVLGAVVVGLMRPGAGRRWMILALAAILVGTGSRTSLLAGLVIVAWVVGTAGNRLLPGVVLVLAIGALVAVLPSDLATSGPFAERSGSDALRAKVLDATEREARSAPVIGLGPTSGRVPLPDRPNVSLLPHNSYFAMVREAGVGYLLLWLGLILAVLVSMIRAPIRNRCLEASILSALVVAVDLGAVLVEVPVTLALGVCLCWVARQRAADEPSTLAPAAEPRPGPA